MSCAELPNEVWVEILSSLIHGKLNRYERYRQLKTCERVSKTFQALILTTPALAKNVFRTRRVLERGEIFFDNIYLDWSRRHLKSPLSMDDFLAFDGVSVYQGDGSHHYDLVSDTMRLIDTAAAEEYATEPPVNVLCIIVADWSSCQVEAPHGSGVTVLAAMKAVLRCLAHIDEDGKSYLRKYRSTFASSGARWSGWDPPYCYVKGHLNLQASPLE